MPYKIVKSGGGYKVKSPHRTFSKKPLSKARARQQQKAIYANAKKESFLRRLDRALMESDPMNSAIDPETGQETTGSDVEPGDWSGDDVQLVSVDMNLEDDTWDDPGDYPSGAGAGPLRSQNGMAIDGEVVFKVSQRAAAHITRAGEVPSEVIDMANDALAQELPGIDVLKWNHKVEGDELVLWPDDYDSSDFQYENGPTLD